MIYRKIKPEDRLPEEPGQYFVVYPDFISTLTYPLPGMWDSVAYWLEEVPESIL